MDMNMESKTIIEYIYKYSKKYKHKVCIISETISLTYGQLFCRAYQYFQYLNKLGIKKKDNIVVKASQSPDYLALQMGIQLTGGIFIPLEKNVSIEYAKKIITETKAILFCSNSDEKFNIGILEFNYFNLIFKENFIIYDNIKFPNENEISEILYTTGTTGKSKGVMLTYKSCLVVAKNLVFATKMEQSNVELIPAPLNHSFALRRFYSNMISGATVVLINGVIMINKFFDFIEKYNVKSICLIPTYLNIIFKLTGDKFGDYKNQLKYLEFSTSAISYENIKKLQILFPKLPLYNIYGSTEAGCSTVYDFNIDSFIPNCIGKPTIYSKIEFSDSNGISVVPTKESPAFITTSGEAIMNGYYGDEFETKKVLFNGKIISSDFGYIDNNGNIFLVGRNDEVINVNGYKISPLEIEEMTYQINVIKDCACIPIKDKFSGQVPLLLVVMEEDKEFDPVKIRKILENYLESYKVPKIIKKVALIPRTHTGKIMKYKLIEMYS